MSRFQNFALVATASVFTLISVTATDRAFAQADNSDFVARTLPPGTTAREKLIYENNTDEGAEHKVRERTISNAPVAPVNGPVNVRKTTTTNTNTATDARTSTTQTRRESGTANAATGPSTANSGPSTAATGPVHVQPVINLTVQNNSPVTVTNPLTMNSTNQNSNPNTLQSSNQNQNAAEAYSS